MYFVVSILVYDHKSKTTYLDFNDFLSQKYSPPVVSSPPEVNPTFIENSENSPPVVNFLSQNFSPPEVNRLLHAKNNHIIMETISSQGEDVVIQYLSLTIWVWIWRSGAHWAPTISYKTRGGVTFRQSYNTQLPIQHLPLSHFRINH